MPPRAKVGLVLGRPFALVAVEQGGRPFRERSHLVEKLDRDSASSRRGAEDVSVKRMGHAGRAGPLRGPAPFERETGFGKEGIATLRDKTLYDFLFSLYDFLFHVTSVSTA